MSNWFRALLAAALLATPPAVSPDPAFGSSTGPAPAELASAGPPGPGTPPAGSPCGAALVEFFQIYALHNAAVLYCPFAACIPLIYLTAELLLDATARVLHACAF